jgi:flagellar motor component MotA
MNLINKIKSMNDNGQLGFGAATGAIGTFFGLFFIGILIFAFALAGSSMLASTEDAVAQNVINQTILGAEQYATFSPVLWVIAGIGLLITILVTSIGVFFITR